MRRSAGDAPSAFCYLVAPRWIAVDDPQTLAEAIMLGGLVVYLPTRSGRRDLLCAAFLVTLASFTKQGLVAIPLAISLDLALRSPRRLLLWLAACGGSALGFRILTKFVAGGDFAGHLLSPRIYLWYNVKYHLMKFLRAFKFPLLVVAAGSPRTFSGDRMLLAAYGVIAIAAGTFLSGVEGTSYNMFQDAAVFLAIASGVTMHELRRRVFAPDHWKVVSAGIALIIAGILAAQPILTQGPKAFGDLLHTRRLLAADADAERAFLADAAYVSAFHGPAICESLLLCYRSGQDFALDPFNSRQNILSGRLDQSELLRRTAAQEFAVIQLRDEICDDHASPTCHILHYPRKFNRFTDEFLYAVDRFYRIDRQSRAGVFYLPK